ncbi:unnamed protein product [Cuscuta campestris]|uniref:Uncharacterized protein n=1 Tax=Cuscuta campestris TaxID=132261 RepID=A0A484KR75_9ASTE|nr:unnamed protein product [Cuscuta campestris]
MAFESSKNNQSKGYNREEVKLFEQKNDSCQRNKADSQKSFYLVLHLESYQKIIPLVFKGLFWRMENFGVCTKPISLSLVFYEECK